ncbi:hypothetical protein DAPPUDRAFT_236002 [Daphnia pulex]|uniref:Uncharacterized protein n=1 Tax=Daphnia pulex TaxID=6669 RepID=E9FZN3_DAPPU|nr:hypothetical protein DAPPUDRAFT_236002 [Daphnia pulex]|eukprot:EFX87087.1 hypothetical protein DAPPUDRAFT_236002 [Daphnia pulex]
MDQAAGFLTRCALRGSLVSLSKKSNMQKLRVISSNKISQYYRVAYYHALLETATSWIQRFEFLEHWTSSFDEINTTLYLIHRPKNNQPPLRLSVTLSLVVQRAAGVTLVRSKCRERREYGIDYLAAKPGMDGWRAIYPALERDSIIGIPVPGSTVLQVFQMIKLLVAATNRMEGGQVLKRDPTSFVL